MKTCFGCKKELNDDRFGKKDNGTFHTRCKICRIEHAQSYHANKQVKSGYCQSCFDEGVFKLASFGAKGTKKKTHCAKHKTENMIDLVDINKGCIVCQEEGVFKIASFGAKGTKKRTHCVEHKTENMIDLKNINKGCIVCQEEGVFKIASFGAKGTKKRTHCTEHKTENMIDLGHINNGCIVCQEEGVFKRASFGAKCTKKGTHCAEHKTENMIDLVNINKGCIVCQEEGVFKRASFGVNGTKKGTHCAEHKTENMIDLVDINRGCIVCQEEGVFKQASFGAKGTKKRTHCTEHKTENMIDLVNINKGCIVCQEEGVFIRASFGVKGTKKKTHCTEHKTENMIDLGHINNGCIVCQEEGVFKRASFGRLFEKKIHCAVHKLNNEYSKNNPMCEKCPSKPMYGKPNIDAIPARCEEHRQPNDEDMLSRKCDLCRDEHFIPSSLTTCAECIGFLKKKASNRGLKEKKIERLLISLSDKIGVFVHDRKIDKGCSNKRPDFYCKDFNDCFSVIVEVDETQHTKYSCELRAELTRMIAIHENDNGGFPTLFIRFNPDPYYYNNKTITAYKEREKQLENLLLGLKNHKSSDLLFKGIGVIYLFYDGYKQSDGFRIEPLTYETKSNGIEIKHNHPHYPSETGKTRIHKFSY